MCDRSCYSALRDHSSCQEGLRERPPLSREHGAGKEQAPGGVFSPTGLSGEAGGQNTRGRRVPGEI